MGGTYMKGIKEKRKTRERMRKKRRIVRKTSRAKCHRN